MPDVSVVVTTKNEEANLRRCLTSVRGQSLGNLTLELIVVDNHSNDRTKEIASAFTARVYNVGPERSAQRNYGVEVSSGEFVLYLDADMALDPTVIFESVSRMRENTDLAGLYIPERIVGRGFFIQVRDFERRFYDGTVIDAVRFVRRADYIAVGGFDAQLYGGEDWDFDKRIRGRGRVATINAGLAHDEGDFSLKQYLRKKSYYSGSLDAYAAKWPKGDADVRRQLGAYYRMIGVFIEKGKFLRLLAHPLLACGMVYLRLQVARRYLARKRQV